MKIAVSLEHHQLDLILDALDALRAIDREQDQDTTETDKLIAHLLATIQRHVTTTK